MMAVVVAAATMMMLSTSGGRTSSSSPSSSVSTTATIAAAVTGSCFANAFTISPVEPHRNRCRHGSTVRRLQQQQRRQQKQYMPSISLTTATTTNPESIVSSLPPSSSSPSSSSSTRLRMSSYSNSGSDYRSGAGDYEQDDDDGRDYDPMASSRYRGSEEDELAETEPEELTPVPMSKNTGNRFVALYFDHEVVAPDDGREPWDLHYDRNDANEDHVMFCRKRNLYNETFNTGSMVDILRSFPMYVFVKSCLYCLLVFCYVLFCFACCLLFVEMAEGNDATFCILPAISSTSTIFGPWPI